MEENVRAKTSEGGVEESSVPVKAEAGRGRAERRVQRVSERRKLMVREARPEIGMSLGFIETRGFIAAVEAADAMIKASNVTPVMFRRLGFTLVVVGVAGEVSAVRTAVEAGVAAARVVGAPPPVQIPGLEVPDIKSSIIANPSPGLAVFLPGLPGSR